MGGTKEVTFEKPFLYSEGGTFEESHSITVRAPGLPHLAVHAKVQAALARAILAFPRQERRADGDDDEAAPEAGDKQEIDALQVLAAGYDMEAYGDFLKWLKKTLTNQPKLAFITGTSQPVTDEVWESLEAEGGLEAVLKVLSAFVGFFLDALGKDSKSATGGAASTGSVSPIRAH